MDLHHVRRTTVVVSLLTTFTILSRAAAQTQTSPTSTRLTFDVVSIKSTATGAYPAGMPSGMTTQPGGRFKGSNVTVDQLISYAFQTAGTSRPQVLGGPEWIASARYEIVATTGTDLTREALNAQLSQLLQSLLEDRFKLRAHVEARQRPVYALVIARADGRLGPNIHPTGIDCEAYLRDRRAAAAASPTTQSRPTAGSLGPCDVSGFGAGRFTGKGVPVSAIASAVKGAVDRPVIDRTSLSGRFDVDLQWAPDGTGANAPASDFPTIFTALQEQLGLKLESTQESLDVIVVDQIERPTPD